MILKDFKATVAAAASALAVLSATLVAAGPAVALPQAGMLLRAPAGHGVKNSYIVVLKPDGVGQSAGATAHRLAVGQRGRVGRIYTDALQGFELSADEAAARRLAADPAVDFVQQNTTVHLTDTQTDPPNHGLDRIDQLTGLDRSYTYPTTAADVRMYVIDTGIYAAHADFGGRVSPGINVHNGGPGTDDCDGHGTHVAGIAGSTSYGVAKGVTLVPVNVFGCANNATAATVIAGVDWVTSHHNAGERAVANVSIGGAPNAALDQAIARSIADGIVYTVAAGNDSANACNVSPARVPNAVTVGYTHISGGIDDIGRPTNTTNIGPCVDLYAPGGGILSTWNEPEIGLESFHLTGSSMAAPFAAGAAAIIWSMHPTQPASAIADDVSHVAAHDVVSYHGVAPANTGGPNRNVYLPQIIVSGLPAYSLLQGDVFSTQLKAAGGTAPYTWSASGLPGGVSIDPTTGIIRGQAGNGHSTVTITARDAAGRVGSATAMWRFRRDGCRTC